MNFAKFFVYLFKFKQMKKVLFINYNKKIEINKYPDVNNFYRNKSTIEDLYKELFLEYDIQADFVSLKDLLIFNSDIYNNNICIKEYCLVFLGLISKSTKFTFLLKGCLVKNKIPYIQYGRFDFMDTKAYEYFKLSLEDFPVIDYVGFSDLTNKTISLIEERINYPFIFKLINVNNWFGIKKITDQVSFRNHFSKILSCDGELESSKKTRKFSQDLYVAQKFIEDYEEHRCIIFQNKILYTISNVRKYINAEEKQIKSNIPDEQIKMLEDASKIISDSNSILGADILKDNKTGKWYILEMNSGPQYIDSSIIAEFNFPKFLVEKIILKINEN